jgi:hypothetical protein
MNFERGYVKGYPKTISANAEISGDKELSVL